MLVLPMPLRRAVRRNCGRNIRNCLRMSVYFVSRNCRVCPKRLIRNLRIGGMMIGVTTVFLPVAVLFVPVAVVAVQGAIRVAVVLLTGVSMVCLRGAVLFVMAVECSLCNPIVDYGDLDEVIVSSKDYCKDCGNRLEQCICKCDGCKRLKRFCNCHIYPPDSGKDDGNEGEEEVSPGTGGSGVLPGTDEGNDGSTIVKKPTQLYDKDQYLDYYKKRIEDFKERYPDKEPPSYYEFYGDFYMHEFLDKTFYQLSQEGREWLKKALHNLQIEMDNMLLNPEYSGIELDEEKFLDAAFETHVKAYYEAGICALSVTDKVYIAITVYPVDLFQSRGLEQVAKIGLKQIAYWITNPLEAIQDWNELKKNYKKYIEWIEDYLKNKQYTDPRNVQTKSTNAEWENMTAEEVFDLLFGDQVRYLQETFGGELPSINE